MADQEATNQIVTPEVLLPSPRLDLKTRQSLRREMLIPTFVNVPGTTATDANEYGVFFLADRAYQIISIAQVHERAGTDGGTVAVGVFLATDGDATGVEIASFSLKLSANVVRYESFPNTATSLPDDWTLRKSQRLLLTTAGTLTNVKGVCVTVLLRPL